MEDDLFNFRSDDEEIDPDAIVEENLEEEEEKYF